MSESAAVTRREAQVPAFKSPKDVPSTPRGTRMTTEYVETVARLAYLWGWPLVNQLQRRASFARAPEPGRLGDVLPIAPVGYVSMLSDYIRPEQSFVTCPNQDTVYGAAFFALEKQPAVVQVPDFGDRFFVYQIVDHRTDSFASIGKQYGSKPGFYLLVGPNWNGAMPQGIVAVCRSQTDLAAVFPRVFRDDTPQDKVAVQGVLNQIDIYPLSEFTGQMKVRDWTKTPSFPTPAGTGKTETEWVTPETFFDELPMVLQIVPPLPGEEALYGMIKSVLDAAADEPKIADTLKEAAIEAEKDLIQPLFAFHNNGKAVGNGWTSPPNGARWGTDYISRAGTAKSNMFDNVPEETRYIYTDFDSTGARLNGASRYTVTFPKGELPPVNGFWSLTVYNKAHLFEPNALNRYSLGTKSKSLKFAPDGSLTLLFQHDSPGADKESNWVPAPSDEFSLYIRSYWPKAEILEGRWAPPPVNRIK